MLDQQAGDLLLARRTPGRGVRVLADVDEVRRGRHQVEDGRADQAIVQDDVGPGQQRGAPAGQEPRIARAGADEVDGHGAAVPPS